MIEVLQLILQNPIPFIVVMIGTGWGVRAILEALFNPHRLRLEHREKMAEIDSRTAMARALTAVPEEAQRNELAQQLLEAYGEAGEGLKNDENGNLVRWELSKKDD